MAKKNKRRDMDDWGPKQPPYRTNERLMKDNGVYAVQGRSEKALKIESWIATTSFIVLILAIIFAFIASMTAVTRYNGMEERLGQLDSPAFKVKYSSLGMSVVEAYFAGDAPPVSLLSGAEWTPEASSTGESINTGSNTPGTALNGGTGVEVDHLALIDAIELPQAIPAAELQKDETGHFSNPSVELLTYSGVIDGSPYRFGVTLLVPDKDDPTKLPYLVAAPTLMPPELLLNSDMVASKPDVGAVDSIFSEEQLPPDVVDMISTWASSYAQDDRATLKRLTGDSNPATIYRGIGGFNLVGTPTIEWSYRVSREDFPTKVVARISFDIEAPMTAQSTRDAEGQIRGGAQNLTFRPRQVMDIMLGDYYAGAPSVTAWGAAGSWITLSDKMNGFVLPPDATETTAPTTSSRSTTGATGTTGNNAPGAPSLNSGTTSRLPGTSGTRTTSRPTTGRAPTSPAPSGR